MEENVVVAIAAHDRYLSSIFAWDLFQSEAELKAWTEKQKRTKAEIFYFCFDPKTGQSRLTFDLETAVRNLKKGIAREA